MSSIFDLLDQQLGEGEIASIARQVGATPAATRSVVEGAVPMLVSALSRNASSAGGAEALLGALGRDHDGSILEDLAGYLGGGSQGNGGGILGHVLGGRRGPVEEALGRSSGLSAQKVGQILMMLAPLIMGIIGRMQRRSNLDSGGLSDLLRGEQNRAQEKSPDLMDALGSLLDANHDGSMMDDLAGRGLDMLGGLMGDRSRS